MIIKGLALIGALWLFAKLLRLLRWRFIVNRDGCSGRHRHWSEER